MPQTVAEFKVNLGVSQLTQVREKHLDLRLIFARLSAPRPNPSIFKAKRPVFLGFSNTVKHTKIDDGLRHIVRWSRVMRQVLSALGWRPRPQVAGLCFLTSQLLNFGRDEQVAAGLELTSQKANVG